jgi:hypothetical protein
VAGERDLRSVHAGSDRASGGEPSVQEAGELPALLVIHAIRPAHDRGRYLLRVRVQGQRSTEVEYAPGTLCATVRRSGYRQVLVIWLGQSNSPARTPAVNALGLKASAGPVGPQIWLPAPT